MYLDTDIILAIVKPSDWLKDVVERKIKVLSDPKTSVSEKQQQILEKIRSFPPEKIEEDVAEIVRQHRLRR